MENANVPLPELIETVKTRLRELQYRPAAIYGFSCYWRKLLEYADERQAKYFTVALGEDFLREVCRIDVTAEVQAADLPRWKVNPPKRAIYLLVDFQNSGSVLRKGKEKYTPVPVCFMEITEHFYAVCRSRYNGERTIEYRQAGHTLEETHQIFKVSITTIREWARQRKETGGFEKKELHRSFRKIDPEKLKAYVTEHPDAYQREMAEAFGCSESGIRDALRRHFSIAELWAANFLNFGFPTSFCLPSAREL